MLPMKPRQGWAEEEEGMHGGSITDTPVQHAVVERTQMVRLRPWAAQRSTWGAPLVGRPTASMPRLGGGACCSRAASAASPTPCLHQHGTTFNRAPAYVPGLLLAVGRLNAQLQTNSNTAASRGHDKSARHVSTYEFGSD